MRATPLKSTTLLSIIRRQLVGRSLTLYTFLSVEQSELDRNLAPSRMRLAAQHVMLPRAGGGLNGEVCNRVVILSVVHVLETFQDERRRERRTAER